MQMAFSVYSLVFPEPGLGVRGTERVGTGSVPGWLTGGPFEWEASISGLVCGFVSLILFMDGRRERELQRSHDR